VTHGREVVVGVVILASLVVAAGATLWLKGTNWGRTLTRIEVLARDAGSLMPGNDVTLRGVTVGRVAFIRVEPDGDAVRLGLEIQGDFAMPDDPVVVIAPESLFGDWQAEILNRSRYPNYSYFDIPPAQEQGEVEVLGGYALPDISRLTATAEAVSENLATLTDRVDRAFNEETAANLQQAISNIQQVSEDIKNLIQQQEQGFADISESVQSAATEINAAATVARSTLERTDSLLAQEEVDTILVNLARASRRFDDISREVGEASVGLDSTLNRMDSTFARVDRIAGMVERGEGTLGRLLADSALAVRAEDVLSELDALLADVRENPGRYVRLSIF
jgi:phospholipid/cholesterol/gamma-HCH transport system substrate-binding protein